MILNKISIENFRLFKDPVSFELRPITILIGQNNSGKSTLLEAIRILAENAKHQKGNNKFPERLNLSYLQHIGIGTVDHFFPSDSTTKAFKVALDCEFQPAPSYYLIQRCLPECTLEITYASEHANSLYSTDSRFVSNFTSEILINIHRYAPEELLSKRQRPSDEGISIKHRYEISKAFLERLLQEIKKERTALELVFTKVFDGGNDSLYQLEEVINNLDSSESTDQYFKIGETEFTPQQLKELLQRLYSISYFTEFYTSLEGKSIQDRIDAFIQGINEVKNKDGSFTTWGTRRYIGKKRDFSRFVFDAVSAFFQNLETHFAEDYIHIDANRSQPKRYYSASDDDLLAKMLFSNTIKLEESDYIIREILGIADSIDIETIDGYLKKVTIGKNGKNYNLTDMGYGISQLLPFILNADSIDFPYSYKPHTWMVSEPESNLHPALQSRLANLFAHQFTEHGSRFIIETHSDHLVRKLQLLYKDTHNKLQREDVQPYYLYPPEEIPPGEDQVKSIRLDDEGNCHGEFEPGFYDEHNRVAISIWNMNFSQRN